MKRETNIILLMLLMLLLSVFVLSASAKTICDEEGNCYTVIDTTIVISNATATINNETIVPITVENPENLAAARINLTYNHNIVNVTNVVSATGGFGSVLSNISNATDKTTIIAFDAVGKSSTFIFAKITLKAGKIGTSPLDLSGIELLDSNGNPILEYAVRNGTFRAMKYPIGDATGNFVIDGVDAMRAAQYTLGTFVLNEDQKSSADVDNDGQVSLKDTLFIAQAAVGLRTL